MNSLADISGHLAALFETGGVPEEMLSGVALRSPVSEECCVQLRFQPRQQRWMLGVDCSAASLDDAAQAQWQENLLRAAHASRWEGQQVGALDTDGNMTLVDCDFPGTPEQAAQQATAQAVEGRLQVLLHRLAALRGLGAEADAAEASVNPSNGPGAEASTGNADWLKA